MVALAIVNNVTGGLRGCETLVNQKQSIVNLYDSKNFIIN
jgi:hypothetical protein